MTSGADVASAAVICRRRGLAAARLDPDLAVTRGSSFVNEVWIGDEVGHLQEQPGSALWLGHLRAVLAAVD